MLQIIIFILYGKRTLQLLVPLVYAPAQCFRTGLQRVYRRYRIELRYGVGRIDNNGLGLYDTFVDCKSNRFPNKQIKQFYILESVASKLCEKTWIDYSVLRIETEETLI